VYYHSLFIKHDYHYGGILSQLSWSELSVKQSISRLVHFFKS